MIVTSLLWGISPELNKLKLQKVRQQNYKILLIKYTIDINCFETIGIPYIITKKYLLNQYIQLPVL